MADQTFQNVVNGELVDSVSGETYDVIDPTTGEVYAQAPMSGAEDVDRAYAAAATAFESWGDSTPQDRAAALLKIADAIESRAEEINAVESKDTGKPLHLTMSEEMPYASDHFRFFAGAARVLEGRSAGEYMADHTSWIRREPIGVVGQVTPWNYPLMMMIWKIAPALAARQHDRPQAQRHHARQLDAAGRAVPGVPAAGRPQRRVRRPRHRPGAGLAQDPADGRDHRVGAGRHGGRRGGVVRPQAGAPRARRQGAGHRLRRRRHREGGRGHRGRRPASTPARTAPPPPGCSPAPASTTSSSRRWPRRRRACRPGSPTARTPTTGRSTTQSQFERVTGMVDRLPDHANVETGGCAPGRRGLLLRADRGLGPPAGRRADPDRDLRSR